MALLECPTRNDLPAYEYLIQLQGTTYTLSFTFNDRMNKWIFQIADILGNAIISGVPVVANWPLLNRFRLSALPPGTFIAFDTSNQFKDPDRFDLGDRVRLFYQESTG